MNGSPEQLEPRIAEILASLPAKTPRSRLEPYRELIREMRRRGRTYREIAQVLGERCGVRIAASSVHEFVRRRSRAKPSPAIEAGPLASSVPAAAAGQELLPRIASQSEPPSDPALHASELRQRIEALKQRTTPAAASPAKPVFTYNENEPLRVGKAGK